MYLDQFALGALEGGHGEFAGVGAELVHQETQPRRPGLPVLQLFLRPRVVSLQAELLGLHQHLVDVLHPVPHVLLKFLLISLLRQERPGVLNVSYVIRLGRKTLDE